MKVVVYPLVDYRSCYYHSKMEGYNHYCMLLKDTCNSDVCPMPSIDLPSDCPHYDNCIVKSDSCYKDQTRGCKLMYRGDIH